MKMGSKHSITYIRKIGVTMKVASYRDVIKCGRALSKENVIGVAWAQAVITKLGR